MLPIIRLLPLLLIISPLQAQADNWLDQAQQLNRDIVNKEDPEARLFLRIQSNLANGQDNPHQIVLKAGYHYTIFADCDRHCNRLGLTLIHNGKIQQRTDTQTAFPMFSWHATQNGRHTLRIKMQECSQDDCLYSINIFEGKRNIF